MSTQRYSKIGFAPDDDQVWGNIVDEHGVFVALTHEPHAQLIVSIPDLLEALEGFLFSFDEVRIHEGYEAALRRFCAAKRTARAVIAKAEEGS